MKNSNKTSLLFNLPEYKTSKERLQLLRIIIAPTHTKVDFGYQATSYYIKGGWVRIDKNTFIRVKATGEKLTMVRTENIPIAPNRLDFKSSQDWLYFSLYFPPLQKNANLIDLIEAEPGDSTDFNYFDIKLNLQAAIALL
jgi:hypothetical protein